MKLITSIALALFASCAAALAQSADPAQPDTKALEAGMNTMYNRLSTQIRDLEQRIRSLEELPEVRIPRLIRANLGQIEAAVQVFCTENRVMECSLRDLVGPDKLIRSLASFDGESYENLRLALNEPEWKVRTSEGLAVTYKLAPTDLKLTEGFANQNEK